MLAQRRVAREDRSVVLRTPGFGTRADVASIIEAEVPWPWGNLVIGGTSRGRYFSEIDHPAEPGVSEAPEARIIGNRPGGVIDGTWMAPARPPRPTGPIALLVCQRAAANAKAKARPPRTRS
jgi:hypothetical protein